MRKNTSCDGSWPSSLCCLRDCFTDAERSFRRDNFKKVIEAQLRRDKSVTLEFWDHFATSRSTSQIGEVDFINIRSVESPAIFLLMKFLLSPKYPAYCYSFSSKLE